MSWKGKQTVIVALDGHTPIPGFVDAHTHLLNDADKFGTDLDGVQQLALENGITTIGDMFVAQDFLNEMRDYNAENRLRIRTNLYLISNTNCGDIVGDCWKGIPPTRVPGEMLRIGGVKNFADGRSCKHPALSYETTPGSGLGALFLTGRQIAEVVGEAQTVGHQMAIHALGDHAFEAAPDGIRSALDGRPNRYILIIRNCKYEYNHENPHSKKTKPTFKPPLLVDILFNQPYQKIVSLLCFCHFSPEPR